MTEGKEISGGAQGSKDAAGSSIWPGNTTVRDWASSRVLGGHPSWMLGLRMYLADGVVSFPFFIFSFFLFLSLPFSFPFLLSFIYHVLVLGGHCRIRPVV